MGKRKSFINRKTAQKYYLMHDDGDNPGETRNVLVPAWGSGDVIVSSNNAPFGSDPYQKYRDMFGDDIFGDDCKQYEDSGYSNLTEAQRRRIVALGLPDDGYNYLVHLRDLGHGGPSKSVSSADEDPNIPDEGAVEEEEGDEDLDDWEEDTEVGDRDLDDETSLQSNPLSSVIPSLGGEGVSIHSAPVGQHGTMTTIIEAKQFVPPPEDIKVFDARQLIAPARVDDESLADREMTRVSAMTRVAKNLRAKRLLAEMAELEDALLAAEHDDGPFVPAKEVDREEESEDGKEENEGDEKESGKEEKEDEQGGKKGVEEKRDEPENGESHKGKGQKKSVSFVGQSKEEEEGGEDNNNNNNRIDAALSDKAKSSTKKKGKKEVSSAPLLVGEEWAEWLDEFVGGGGVEEKEGGKEERGKEEGGEKEDGEGGASEEEEEEEEEETDGESEGQFNRRKDDSASSGTQARRAGYAPSVASTVRRREERQRRGELERIDQCFEELLKAEYGDDDDEQELDLDDEFAEEEEEGEVKEEGKQEKHHAHHGDGDDEDDNNNDDEANRLAENLKRLGLHASAVGKEDGKTEGHRASAVVVGRSLGGRSRATTLTLHGRVLRQDDESYVAASKDISEFEDLLDEFLTEKRQRLARGVGKGRSEGEGAVEEEGKEERERNDGDRDYADDNSDEGGNDNVERGVGKSGGKKTTDAPGEEEEEEEKEQLKQLRGKRINLEEEFTLHDDATIRATKARILALQKAHLEQQQRQGQEPSSLGGEGGGGERGGMNKDAANANANAAGLDSDAGTVLGYGRRNRNDLYNEDDEKRWDCESVLSLRSNLENHPRTLSLERLLKVGKGRGRGGQGGKGGENEGSGMKLRAPEPVQGGVKQGVITLSARTGLPSGYAYRGGQEEGREEEGREVGVISQISEGNEEEDEEGDEEEKMIRAMEKRMGQWDAKRKEGCKAGGQGEGEREEEEDENGDRGEEGSEEEETATAANGGMMMSSEARKKGESAEEKKARKAAVKEAQRNARQTKKGLKNQFSQEKKVTAKRTAGQSTCSVFSLN